MHPIYPFFTALFGAANGQGDCPAEAAASDVPKPFRPRLLIFGVGADF
ncbi:hypothetical protein J421_5394 (plasmid) [Gemmatirosa kalamazoonensis]|uniref:Uncharacterized protein n=1 Tax=Gemmatirosa kalamazoonensis TaxID=861299 RepID=W0RPJ8_9BACT|nr:hypothetical protein J421_5394 [Gemmatirosa kalamazoonensis]